MVLIVEKQDTANSVERALAIGSPEDAEATIVIESIAVVPQVLLEAVVLTKPHAGSATSVLVKHEAVYPVTKKDNMD
jgi:hypothetical protein